MVKNCIAMQCVEGTSTDTVIMFLEEARRHHKYRDSSVRASYYTSSQTGPGSPLMLIVFGKDHHTINVNDWLLGTTCGIHVIAHDDIRVAHISNVRTFPNPILKGSIYIGKPNDTRDRPDELKTWEVFYAAYSEGDMHCPVARGWSRVTMKEYSYREYCKTLPAKYQNEYIEIISVTKIN